MKTTKREGVASFEINKEKEKREGAKESVCVDWKEAIVLRGNFLSLNKIIIYF